MRVIRIDPNPDFIIKFNRIADVLLDYGWFGSPYLSGGEFDKIYKMCNDIIEGKAKLTREEIEENIFNNNEEVKNETQNILENKNSFNNVASIKVSEDEDPFSSASDSSWDNDIKDNEENNNAEDQYKEETEENIDDNENDNDYNFESDEEDEYMFGDDDEEEFFFDSESK